MSRSYSTFREQQPFADGWKKAIRSASAPSDHVHRPLMVETEGKQLPIIRHASGSNGESYVIKAEIVEHSFDFAPQQYRFRWQPREEFRDFGVENRHDYQYPDRKIEEFITKIQDEVFRCPTRPVVPPLTNGWRSAPHRIVPDDERNFWRDDHKKLSDHNDRKYDDERNFWKDDRKKLQSDHNDRKYDDDTNLWRDDRKKLGDHNDRKYDDDTNLWRDDRKKLGDHNDRKYDDDTNLWRDDRKKLSDHNDKKYDEERNFWRDDPKKLSGHNDKKYDDERNFGRDDRKKMSDHNDKKYDDERNFWRDDRKKLSDSPNWEGRHEPQLNNTGIINTHPMIGKNRDVGDQFYERPRGIEGPNARNHPLSKPTNQINTATEFLKEAIKPSYGNGKESEKDSNTSVYTEASRPARAFPLGTSWRTGTNMSRPETKVEPKDYDSEEEEEDSRNPLGKFNELKITNNQGGEKKDGYGNPKRNAVPVQFGQTAVKKKIPDTIDSKEASRRYGKVPSKAMEEEEYEGIITSKEAMAKYKGALVQ